MHPLTYCFEFSHGSDLLRPYIMHEFAVNGAKHLVLSEYFIRKVLEKRTNMALIASEMESEGLSFVDSHASYGPYNDLYLPEGSERRKMLTTHRLTMEIAADFGVRTMAIHVGDRHEVVEGIPFDELHENLLRSLDELLPVAEKCGIVLSIENAYNICNTADKLVAAAKYFDSPFLGVCYDAGHANLMHPAFKDLETPSVDYYWYGHDKVEWDGQMLEKMLPYVTCCHLQDNDGIGDKHWLPGKGNIDWAHIMGLLKTAPRLKSFQCEAIPVREHISIRELCSGFSAFIEKHTGGLQ